MTYEHQELWLPTVCALCPSEDTAGNGTTTLTDFALVSNGVLTNAATPANNWVTSEGKLAIELDGTNDHVINGFCPISGASRLSVSAWIKKASSSYGPHITIAPTLADTSGRITIQLWNDGFCYVVVGGAAYGYFALNDTSWHHLLVAYNGAGVNNTARLLIWCDGTAKTLAFSSTIPSVLPTAAQRLILGVTGSGGASYGAGLLDDIRVTVHTPTASERTLLFSGRGAAYTEASSGTARPSHPMYQQVIG